MSDEVKKQNSATDVFKNDNNFKNDKGNQDDKKRIIRKRFVFKKKFCRFCKDQTDNISFKDVDLLYRFTKSGGKILPRRFTGNCARHQRLIARAIKRARSIALLPYVSE